MSTENDPAHPAESGDDILDRPLDPLKLEERREDDAPARPGAHGPVTEGPRPHPHGPSPNMLPARNRPRTWIERTLVRLVATGGIVGIGVAIAAIMTSSHSQGWLIGLVVAAVTVVLAAILWSSRTL